MGGAWTYVGLTARERAPGDPSPAAGLGVAARRRRARPGVRLAVVAGLPLLVVLSAAAWLWTSTPSASDLDGRVAALTAAGAARPLPPSEIPPILAEAVIAVEDERFYLHHGLDTLGIARAAWVDLSGWCGCEGGSTITQQLAKMVYFPDDGRIRRKLPGMAVALKIEMRHDKADILADYLSVFPSGYGLTGALQASCAFFGRALSGLTVAQAAEIAGMIQAPSAYDPRFHPDLAAARRAVVLGRMVEAGFITPAQAATAGAAPVVLRVAGASPGC